MANQSKHSILHRRAVVVVLFVVAVLAAPSAIDWLQGGNAAKASHVSANALAYSNCGRVFPDPQGFWPSASQAPQRSPFAKGNVSCQSTDFLQYQEMIDGLTFLETLFPNFVELYTLEDDFGDGSDCAASTSSADNCSAGLPRQSATPGRVKSDIYLLRITDERVPDDGKKFFVVNLSIHGIERAGAEGGVRAAEDLATWSWCEARANSETVEMPGGGASVDCSKEGSIPHPIMETQPTGSSSAGAALRSSAVYFVFANADGWRRGDTDNLTRAYQRYNGNGVDLNRDWPSFGYVERRYTPWSEPESRAIGKALKSIRPTWDSGIDLHGQLVDRAFSFTMLNQDEADFGKNQRILQMVKGAWSDAESRLGWSPLIIPNDQPQSCEPAFLITACDKMYGVQWGTVWDTIAYTTTGAMGDWMNFDGIGLGADGFGNEMSFSHLSNCGTGTCYDSTIEQMHIDGNKSLIFGMVHYTLIPEDQTFRAPGKVGYIQNPARVKNPGVLRTPALSAGLPPQDPILDATLNQTNGYLFGFTVLGPSQARHNGGLEAKATAANVGGFSASSATASLILERSMNDEADPGGGGCGEESDEWSEVNQYYNQAPTYLQAGQAVHANDPEPGRYRVCLVGDFTGTGGNTPVWDLDITFYGEQSWADPGQAAYDVSNMKFFEDLSRYMAPGQLTKVEVADVLSGKVDLSSFTSLVIADDPFPGYSEPIPSGPPQDPIVHSPPSKTSSTIPCVYDPEFGGIYSEECVASYEFTSDPARNNQSISVELDYEAGDSWTLEVERKLKDGRWDVVGYSNTYSGKDIVVIEEPDPGAYRAAIINGGAVAQPTRLEISFSGLYTGPPRPASQRSAAELATWGARLKGFVENGGNLVLTDGALRDLAYMGTVPRSAVGRVTGYAGFIQFTQDGASHTFGDPLAKDLRQPGAAEGPDFRHQTYEPIPLGFRIPEDRDPFSGWAVNWTVNQSDWEKAGGRTVGRTGAEEVSLGELAIGRGRVRIIGSLLPMPTEDHYHPYGLTSYAVTYSGYQVLNNALQWPPLKVAGEGLIASTGPPWEGGSLLGLALLGLGLLLLRDVRLASRRPGNT